MILIHWSGKLLRHPNTPIGNKSAWWRRFRKRFIGALISSLFEHRVCGRKWSSAGGKINWSTNQKPSRKGLSPYRAVLPISDSTIDCISPDPRETLATRIGEDSFRLFFVYSCVTINSLCKPARRSKYTHDVTGLTCRMDFSIGIVYRMKTSIQLWDEPTLENQSRFRVKGSVTATIPWKINDITKVIILFLQYLLNDVLFINYRRQ